MNISVYFRIISTHITMDILDILDVLTTSPVTNFSAFGSKIQYQIKFGPS